MDNVLRTLSLGAGVQSTALLIMSENELIPRFDYAIFADTGGEPDYVYEYLDYLKSITKTKILIVKHSKRTLEEELRMKLDLCGYPAIPMYTIEKKNGKVVNDRGFFHRRTCTSDFKIEPIERMVRKLYKENLTWAERIETSIGISIDEAARAKPAKLPFVKHKFPLLDWQWTREDCIHYLKKLDIRTPAKSACYFCPYRNDKEWKDLKERDPEFFEKAVELDEYIRHSSQKQDLQQERFLYRNRVPLKDATFEDSSPEAGLNFFVNECEGMCGF